MGATSGVGTAYSSGASVFIPGSLCGSCFLVFSILCIALEIVVCHFPLAILVSSNSS